MYLICVFNLCAERVMDNIQIIYDELKRNQIHIDQPTLAFHINTILYQNKDMYSQVRVSDFEQLYREIMYYGVFSLCI